MLDMGTQRPTAAKLDVPDHVLYTVGTCILVIGSVGIIGNLLVIYAFYRYKNSVSDETNDLRFCLLCVYRCVLHVSDLSESVSSITNSAIYWLWKYSWIYINNITGSFIVDLLSL